MFQGCKPHRRTAEYRRSRSARSGFTIIEMMLALAIIGIMAMAIAPAMSEVLANRRQGAAPHRLINAARVAQARTKETGAAHMLRVLAPNDALGRFEVWMGMTSSCVLTPWPFTAAFGPELAEDMAEFNPTGAVNGDAPTTGDEGRQIITLRGRQLGGAGDLDEIQICYEPNGRTFTADSNALALVPHAVAYELTFRRAIDGVARGVPRQVLFPPGAAPRLR
jgi:prepilin-type N-terminal cleavage/methylation domain-containing protein